MNLASNMKGSRKRFYKHINNKKKMVEKLNPLLNGAGDLVT